MIVVVLTIAAYYTPGPHQMYLRSTEKEIVWCLYWLGLGVLSSVGLGTGLHTFLLYLGPHIAAVTLAAYECGSLNFPSPSYPDRIVCPENEDDSSRIVVTIWSIMSKVRLEAMMWGAGTALGELPPYFMARAARLSSMKSRRNGRRRSTSKTDDIESLAEFQELQKKQQNPQQLTWLDRSKLGVERLVKRVGFFGILACASIPNPLFDLAGITCGHFLVPFWTFFGATLIGKAVVKMHIQKVFIIFLFSKHHVAWLLEIIKSIPVIGPLVIEPIEKFFNKQQTKLQSGKSDGDNGNIIGNIFEIFIFVMVGYFIITILNSLAQSRVARIQKARREEKLKK